MQTNDNATREPTASTPFRDSPTSEMLLFAISLFNGALGLSVFAALIWEVSPYRGGLSDKLVPITLLAAFLAFPVTAAVSIRLYKNCRDGFSQSLRMVVFTWQTLLFLAWCFSVILVAVFIVAWLTGNFTLHGQQLAPPAWSPFA